jgi:hypothetical protein
LWIADTVDGDDDVGCPSGLGRVLTDDDDRAGCAGDKRRTDGVNEARKARAARSGGIDLDGGIVGLEAERIGRHVGTEQHGICSVSPGHTARPPAALTPVSQDDVPVRSGP